MTPKAAAFANLFARILHLEGGCRITLPRIHYVWTIPWLVDPLDYEDKPENKGRMN